MRRGDGEVVHHAAIGVINHARTAHVAQKAMADETILLAVALRSHDAEEAACEKVTDSRSKLGYGAAGAQPVCKAAHSGSEPADLHWSFTKGNHAAFGCADQPDVTKETTMRPLLILFTACILSACSAEQPNTVVSPKLDSGITSSNGGGQRALGNQPNIGVTTPVAPAK